MQKEEESSNEYARTARISTDTKERIVHIPKQSQQVVEVAAETATRLATIVEARVTLRTIAGKSILRKLISGIKT